MASAVWHLYKTDDLGEWVMVANFQSLAAAAGRIIEIEAIPLRSLFFEMQVSADAATDDEALGHLEYQGRHAGYVIKREAL